MKNNMRNHNVSCGASPHEDMGSLRYTTPCRSVLRTASRWSAWFHIADADARSKNNSVNLVRSKLNNSSQSIVCYNSEQYSIESYDEGLSPTDAFKKGNSLTKFNLLENSRTSSTGKSAGLDPNRREVAMLSMVNLLVNLLTWFIGKQRLHPVGLRIATVICCLMSIQVLVGQEEVDLNPKENTHHALMVEARSFGDEIKLRWAPTTSRAWRLGNARGYRVMRYTLMRDNKLVDDQEMKRGFEPSGGLILPWKDTARWEALAMKDSIAAIAAQTIIGGSFEISTSSEGVERLYNMMNEQESRYSFGLFAADHSFEAAKAMGLGLVDKDVRPNETYLYRVFIDYGAEGEEAELTRLSVGFSVDTGYISLSPADLYLLPKVREVLVDFSDKQAIVSWNKELFKSFFVSYVIERSEDGINWTIRNTSPFVGLDGKNGPEERAFMMDTLPHNGRPYFYRVIGRSIFDDYGIPSDPVQGIGVPDQTTFAPHVSGVMPDVTGGFLVSWEYDARDEDNVLGFKILRSSKEGGIQMALTGDTLLPPSDRLFADPSPGPINYYSVIVVDQYGREKTSFPRLAMINDSIPPAPPQKISGAILSDGKMIITWAHNTEPDILGYRVFMAYNPNDEFSQLTKTICYDNYFIDSTNLNTLSQFIYIKLTAIDNNLNTSPLSDFGVLTLPDTIPPAPPAIKEASASGAGVHLQWANSRSLDVAKHEVMRRLNDEDLWKAIHTIQGKAEDDFSEFIDKEGDKGMVYQYQVIATDYSDLSSASDIVKLSKIDDFIRPELKDLKFNIDRREKSIQLTWRYESPEKILNFEIYRVQNGSERVYIGNLSPYDLLDADQGRTQSRDNSVKYTWKDVRPTMNTTYEYEIKCRWIDGGRTPYHKSTSIAY